MTMTTELALITGASSGIGAALAQRLAADGRQLALVARRRDRLEALAGTIRAAHGVSVHVLPMDLLAPGAVAGLVGRLARRGLTVDWLVNNAGVADTGRFDALPADGEVERVRLNVEVPVELTRRLLPGMVKRGHGVVMNVASLAAFSPLPFAATYGATKAFLLSFSEAIAIELRETGVHVVCVCPGFTHTELIEHAHIDEHILPEPLWLSAEQVADEAVRAVGRQTVVVNGMLNGLTAAASHVVPRSLLARVAAAMLRPVPEAPSAAVAHEVVSRPSRRAAGGRQARR
jgi:short-subunit dehydrogenase